MRCNTYQRIENAFVAFGICEISPPFGYSFGFRKQGPT
jgi:hypothetical protein